MIFFVSVFITHCGTISFPSEVLRIEYFDIYLKYQHKVDIFAIAVSKIRIL